MELCVLSPVTHTRFTAGEFEYSIRILRYRLQATGDSHKKSEIPSSESNIKSMRSFAQPTICQP